MRTIAAVMAVLTWGCGGSQPTPDAGTLDPVPDPRAVSCPNAFRRGSGSVLGVEGFESTVTLDGPETACTSNTVGQATVRDPDGRVVEATVTQSFVTRFLEYASGDVHTLRVRFVPDRPGRWTLEARWSSGSVTTLDLLVALPLPTGAAVSTRFTDRMDLCLRGPFRTRSGVTLCQRDDGQVWAYGSTGAVVDHFSGVQLAVRGDEVWSWQEGQLEHRTASSQTLRFDGAVPIAGSWIEGPTTPGRAVRGEPERVFEISWDGSQLQRSILMDRSGFDSPMLLLEGTQLWTGTGCLVEPGCTQATCPPVITCPYFIAVPFGADAQGLWEYLRASEEHGVVSVTPRPFSKTQDPLQRPAERLALQTDEGPLSLSTNRAPMVERTRLGTVGPWLFIPRVDDGAIGWRALRTGGAALTMTDEFTIRQGADVFTLVATPTPALP